MIRRWSNTTLAWGVGLSTLLVAPLAWSQSVDETASEGTPETTEGTPEATEAPLEGQRNIGVLVAVGSYTGFGGGVQLGSPKLGLRAAAGWVPLLIALEAPEEEPELKFYSGYQVAGDAYARAMEGKKGANIGVSLGYRYHSLMGSGVALGGYGSFRVSKVIDGFVQGGLVWFFSGEDKLREEKSLPEDVDFGSPGPSINYLISLGLLLFP